MARATLFGALLRQQRLEAGLTIEGLAEASGVSARGIGNLERGERTVPQRRTVAALAAGLELDEAASERLLSAARAARGGGLAHALAMPRGIDDFVGRVDELALLGQFADDAARSGQDLAARPVVVSGPPGSGKSTLALHAARELADRFPDGQLMVDLRGTDDVPPSAEESMLWVLKALDVPDTALAKSGAQARPELYRRVLAERRLLLVLDNARDETQVRPLLPGSGAGMVIVTSRRVLTGLENVHRLSIGELSPDEAAALLTSVVGADRGAPEELREVAGRCGHLPLALRVAGNWLATRTGWSVRRLADRLALEEQRLNALTAGDVRVSAAFDLSYRQLTPAASRMFRLLALVDGPNLSTACAAALTGWDMLHAEDILDELVEVGLLGMDGDRYRLHDLLRLFARTRLRAEETAEDAAAARRALHRWLLETATVAGRWYEPAFGAPPADWRGTVDLSSADRAGQWLRTEAANWLGALRAAAIDGEHTTVVEVAESLHWFSDQFIFWGHWTEVFSTAALSARCIGDLSAEATQLNYHAWTFIVCEGDTRAGRSKAAEALETAERAGDLTQQAWAHFYMAWADHVVGDHSLAIEHNDRAAKMFKRAGEHHGLLQTMTSQCMILLRTGQAQEAVDEAARTLDFVDGAAGFIESHIADFTRIGLHFTSGSAHMSLGQWDEAVDSLRIATDISCRTGNRGMESRSLAQLGEALLSAGRKTEARDALTRCLQVDSGADPQQTELARIRLSRLDADGAPAER
ncbi:helix-turn-helix domain-containing protein [Streptomyces pseudogriseolus]|uniref:ATP-binding protein n=1 Tax=Streptomyces pseudogriseolus TaxID=36817 RepID=UPI00346D5234